MALPFPPDFEVAFDFAFGVAFGFCDAFEAVLALAFLNFEVPDGPAIGDGSEVTSDGLERTFVVSDPSSVSALGSGVESTKLIWKKKKKLFQNL